MKKIIIFLEDEELEIIKNFKKKIKAPELSDEKAFKIIAMYFAENFKNKNKKWKTLEY